MLEDEVRGWEDDVDAPAELAWVTPESSEELPKVGFGPPKKDNEPVSGVRA